MFTELFQIFTHYSNLVFVPYSKWRFSILSAFLFYAMPPDMVCDDLCCLCTSKQGCRIHFWGRNTNREDSVTSSDRMIMRTIAYGTNSLTWTLNHNGGLAFFTFWSFIFGSEGYQQKNMHKRLTTDGTRTLWPIVYYRIKRQPDPYNSQWSSIFI